MLLYVITILYSVERIFHYFSILLLGYLDGFYFYYYKQYCSEHFMDISKFDVHEFLWDFYLGVDLLGMHVFNLLLMESSFPK